MLIFQGVSIHKHPAAMRLAKEHQLGGISTKGVDISCSNSAGSEEFFFGGLVTGHDLHQSNHLMYWKPTITINIWGNFSSSTSARVHQIVYAHPSNKYIFGHFGQVFELVLCFESNMVAWTCPKQYISIKSIPFWFDTDFSETNMCPLPS